MKRFDYDSLMEQYIKKYKVSLVVFVIISLVFVSTFVLGIVFSTYENRNYFMIIFSIVLSILIANDVGFLLFGVIANKKNQNQLFYILGGYMSVTGGYVSEIDDEITTISGRRGIEVTLRCEDDELRVFYDPVFGEIPFKVGENLKVKISELFIIEYEVIDA